MLKRLIVPKTANDLIAMWALNRRIRIAPMHFRARLADHIVHAFSLFRTTRHAIHAPTASAGP